MVARRTVEPCCRPLIWRSFRVAWWDFGNRETNSPDKRSPPPARTGPPLVRLGGCPLGVPFAPPPSRAHFPPRASLRARGGTVFARAVARPAHSPPPAPPAPRATARSFARALARLAAHRADIKPSPSSSLDARGASHPARRSVRARHAPVPRRTARATWRRSRTRTGSTPTRCAPGPGPGARSRAAAAERAPRHQPILSTFEPFRVAFRDDRAAPLLSRDRTHARLFTPPPRPTPPRSSRSPRW